MARGRKAAVVEAGPVEGPWELPEGWRWEPLGAVVTQSSGKLQPDPTSDLPFVGLDSVEPNSTTLAATVPFSTMRSAANSFSRGEVLYGRLRPYLNKVWLADRAGACSGEFIVLQPRADLEAEYLKWLLHHGGFVRFASHAVTGDRPRIDLAKMSGYPVPLPPPDTQRRIVARIDELFSELEDGEAALVRARADLETYRKSLLKAAVTGELTADWRAAKNGASEGQDKSWPKINLGDVCKLQGGFAFKSDDYTDEGVPLIRIGDITDGTVAPGPSTVRLPSLYATEYPRFVVQEGDILIAMSGATTGKFGVYRSDLPSLLNQRVGRFQIVEPAKLTVGFLLTIISHLQPWILAAAYGGAQPNISSKGIEAFEIALPPLDEQQQIAAVWAELSEAIMEKRHAITTAEQLLANLRQSILAAAFRGELVQ